MKNILRAGHNALLKENLNFTLYIRTMFENL